MEQPQDEGGLAWPVLQQLRGRADAIRQRLRASESYDLEPLEGEKTDPGIEAG